MESLQSIKEEIQTAQTALELATTKLKELENTQKPKKSLIASPVAGSWEDYYCIDGRSGKLRSFICMALNNGHDLNGACFTTEKEADAYAEAFETMVMLRKCEWSVKPNDDECQHIFSYVFGEFHFSEYTSLGYKTKCVSPSFETEEDARNAIKKVGEERVIRMFNTFSGDI